MDRKKNTKARGKTLRQKTNPKGSRKLIRNGQEYINLSAFQITPPRVVVRFDYKQASILAAATTAASYYWNVNGAYDIDPAAGSKTLTGFNEWMALYSVFHVRKVNVKMTLVNMENLPVRISTCWFPATQTTYTPIMWGNEHAIEHRMLPPVGRQVTVIRRSVDLATLLNKSSYEGDLTQYYGTSASNPSSLMSFNIGVSTVDGSNLSTGVYYNVEFDLETELTYPTKLSQS